MPEEVVTKVEEMYAPRYVRRAVQSNQLQKLPDAWRMFFVRNGGVPKKLYPMKPWRTSKTS